MLDRDLAVLYEVETRALNQAVQRNIKRFPDDFMFQLSSEEFNNLKSQFVTSSWGGVRKMPYAFTRKYCRRKREWGSGKMRKKKRWGDLV
jgi:superfamily I DNA and RNA helicase